MRPFCTLEDFTYDGKRVFVRVDFNVPLKDGKVSDDTRIKAALPTLKYLLAQRASLIIASHLGRPKGVDPSASLKVVGVYLQDLLHKNVMLAPHCRGPETKRMALNLKPGEILLLENVRFDAGEETNDAALAREWASYAQLYVNDAFGTCHRAHASVAAITELLPSAAGFLLQKELDCLLPILEHPVHPFIVLLGGSKLSSKLKVIESLLPKADTILIGGAMVFTFLRAQGMKTGSSLVEEDFVAKAATLLKSKKIVLPSDVRVAKDITASEADLVSVASMPDNRMGVDIGPKSIEDFTMRLKTAKTVLWNGPVGVFENPAFSIGTHEIARALGNLNNIRIIGGGDSAAAVASFGLQEKMTHVSTGGGATLELLENGSLPAIDCLKRSQQKFCEQ